MNPKKLKRLWTDVAKGKITKDEVEALLNKKIENVNKESETKESVNKTQRRKNKAIGGKK